MSLAMIPICAIQIDSSTNFRDELNADVVTDYAESMRSGETFPPIDVYEEDCGNVWLADGFHRVAAAELAELEEIMANVYDGTARDALLHAAGANAEHGLQRTNDDKRRAVRTLLGDPEWSQQSDRWIAKTCRVSQPFVSKMRKGDVIAHLKQSNSVEWYTPARYVEAARELMGGIDLDPASCETANETVGAVSFFGQDDDGLAQEWKGRVWLNPPYGKINGQSSAGTWSFRLLDSYQAGDVTEACLLIGSNTETKHFQALRDYPVCLVNGRINFEGARGTQNTQGTAIFYLGDNPERFREVFKKFGPVFSTKW